MDTSETTKNAEDVLVAKGIAETARDNVLNIATDLLEGASFYKHTQNIGLASKNSDGTVNSIINLGSDGTAYIGGRNIVLDGNTIVDGTFTITDKMIAPNAEIDGAKIQDATIGSAKIASLDVGKISGNTTNFVQSYWNAINNQVSINGNRIRIDGPNSFSEIRDGGFISDDVVGTRMMLSNGRIVAYDSRQTDNWGTLFHLGANRSTRTPFLGGTLAITHQENFTIGRYWASGSAETTGITEYLKFNYSGDRIESNGRITALKQLNAHESIQLVGSDSILNFPGGQLRGNESSQNATIEAVNDFTIRASGNKKLVASNNLVMYAALDTNGFAVIGNSDARLKHDIVDDEINSIEAIKSWRMAGFNWIDTDKPQDRQFSVIAQSAPEITFADADGFLHVNTSKQINMNTHAVQQLANEKDAEIEGLTRRIEVLENERTSA